jgi:putative acetyltransferase
MRALLIRSEERKDWAAVHTVNESAFGTPAEANLVDALRDQAQPIVSLVGEDSSADNGADNGIIVGHIMFSPVSLPGHPALRMMGLAPLAVAPAHQRNGIGSALVRAGLEQCRQLGFGAVVVLGHPAYYPRFGFAPSTRFGIGCEYEVPEEVFMVVELDAGVLRGASGKVKYHPAFSDL